MAGRKGRPLGAGQGGKGSGKGAGKGAGRPGSKTGGRGAGRAGKGVGKGAGKSGQRSGAPSGRPTVKGRPAKGSSPRGSLSKGSTTQGAPSKGGRSQALSRSQADVEPQAKRGLGGLQLEGRHAVREALIVGTRRVGEITMAADLDSAPILDDILELANDQRVAITEVSRTKLDHMARTDAPQGVVAFARALPEFELDDLTSDHEGQPPFLLVVDGVTDPGNLGTLLRSAECAGVTGVILPKHRAAHLTPAAVKSAAGAIEYLRFCIVPGIPATLQRLSSVGVWTVGLDADGETSVDAVQVADGPIALVVGAEGAGLSKLARARCDVVASIPMRGHLASLNTAAAGAVACFDIARARR